MVMSLYVAPLFGPPCSFRHVVISLLFPENRQQQIVRYAVALTIAMHQTHMLIPTLAAQQLNQVQQPKRQRRTR